MSKRLALSLTLLLARCATTVIPPSAVLHPRCVFILDHGKHSSLAIATATGDLARYSYGDWRYYALNDTGVLSVLRLLFTSSSATLGRARLPGPPRAATLKGVTREGVETIYALTVEADAADALLARLQAELLANLASLTYNPDYDLDFVRLPEPYSILHDSNQVVAGWLRELGCEVRGAAVLSDWRVAAPGAGACR